MRFWERVLLRLDLVRGEEPGADRPVADPELCCDLSKAVALRLQLQNLFAVHRTSRATEFLAVLSRILNPGTDPFPD